MISSTVLITTAINPPSGLPILEMLDPSKRIVTAKAAIFFFVGQGIQNIVIADATNTEVLTAEEISGIQSLGIRIEQICYQQDTALIQTYGKGYGEGKLIEYAIDNSRILINEEYFYKCTGKIICLNLKDIHTIITNNHLKSIFWKHTWGLPKLVFGLDTRFFYTSREFFKKHLSEAYKQTNDFKMEYIELVAEKAIEASMCKTSYSVRPRLTGFAGGDDNICQTLALGDYENSFQCWVLQ